MAALLSLCPLGAVPFLADGLGRWEAAILRLAVYATVAGLVRLRVLDVQTRVQLALLVTAAVATDVAHAAVAHAPVSMQDWLLGSTGAFVGLCWGRTVAHARQADAWRRRSTPAG